MKIKKCFGFYVWFLMFAFILSSCASTQTYKTMGLTETPQPVIEKQIKIFERGEAITDNFQILGKVTINCNTGVSKKNAIKEMKRISSQSGANGIVDIHRGPGCAWRVDAGVHYNGLMVKWLQPDQKAMALKSKFLLSRLPIKNPESQGEILVLENHWGYGVPFMDFQWINTLTFKGYYVLPEYTGNSSSLSENAQLLIRTEISSNSASTDLLPTLLIGLGRDYDSELNIQVIDKESGEIIKEKQTKGHRFQDWIQMIAESGSDIAIGEAINEALKDLPKIE